MQFSLVTTVILKDLDKGFAISDKNRTNLTDLKVVKIFKKKPGGLTRVEHQKRFA